MKVLGALVLLLSGCSNSSGDPEVAPGRALYDANCSSCHGKTAEGDGPMASSLPVQPPRLMDHLGHHTDAQLVQLIRGGVPPAMPPSSVTENEVQLIVDYVWTLVPEAEIAALRAEHEHIEAEGDSAMNSMAGMPAMPGMTPDSTFDQPAVPAEKLDVGVTRPANAD
jgi:hypothetical protein